MTFCSLLLLVGREGLLLPLSGLVPVQYFEREHLCSITRPREFDHVGQLREIAVRLLKEDPPLRLAPIVLAAVTISDSEILR